MRRIWAIFGEAAIAWMDDNATHWSASIAFYALLSIAPLFVIAIAIAGAIFGDAAASGALSLQLRDLMGANGAEVAATIIKHANHPSKGLVASIIGIIMLLYGASGIFVELVSALNSIWNVKPKPGTGSVLLNLLRNRFLSFGMVLVIGFFLLVSLVISTVLAVCAAQFKDVLPGWPFTNVMNFIISFLFITLLFALIFKYLPDTKVFWRHVWFGALVTSALFTIGKLIIGYYLGQVSVTSPFGAAGSMVAFVIWVYYSGMIVLFGAELTKVATKQGGLKTQPIENAPTDRSLKSPTDGFPATSQK